MAVVDDELEGPILYQLNLFLKNVGLLGWSFSLLMHGEHVLLQFSLPHLKVFNFHERIILLTERSQCTFAYVFYFCFFWGLVYSKSQKTKAHRCELAHFN